MTATGYSLPSSGVEYPGFGVGLMGSNDAWLQNPNTAQFAMMPYSQITNLYTAAASGFNPAPAYNFKLYKLTPTGLRTITFSGGRELSGSDSNLGNHAWNLVVYNDVAYLVFGSASRSIYNSFNVSAPTTITAAQAFIIQSGGLPDGSVQNVYAFMGIDTTGNPIMVFTQEKLAGLANQVWGNYDFTQAINSFAAPATQPLIPFVVGYDPSNLNRWFAPSLDSINVRFQEFTIDPTTNVTFTGTQTNLSFDNDGVTGIALATETNIGPWKFYASFGGYIAKGTALSGSSSWYLISTDLTKYWNLKFGSGPSDPTFGPVVDLAAVIYSWDNATGAVFMSGSAPVVPYVVDINQTPSFPLHKCFQPIKPRKIC